MKKPWFYLILVWWMTLFSFTLLAAETRLFVEHQHVFRSCRGELIFREDMVEYATPHKDHARLWKYQDIQQLGVLGTKEISILTYEDQKIKFGKDRNFKFKVSTGEITPALWTYLETKVTKPLVSAVIAKEISPKFQIPVKHLRGWGGTQGVLEISEQYIIYKTDAPKDSRIWRYENISSMGSTGPYQLRLTSMERVNGEHGGEKNFIFDLKEHLNEEAYDFVWWKLNGPKISLARP
jgi:hypothetical protein